MTGYIGKIETLGLVDGPGIRTVVFLEGCLLRCLYCHNPEMWTITKKNAYKVDELIEILLKYKSYYDSSNGGVTFSGGEPLYQEDFLLAILKKCHQNKIHTCLDTSGFFLSEAKLNKILDFVDLIILDIKHINDREYQKMTGKNMQKLKTFINTCNQKNKKIWIRSVIVPGINDNKDYLEKLSKCIKQINNVEKIELLPYDSIGKLKYSDLNIDYKLKNTLDMSSEKLAELEEYLLSLGN